MDIKEAAEKQEYEDYLRDKNVSLTFEELVKIQSNILEEINSRIVRNAIMKGDDDG